VAEVVCTVRLDARPEGKTIVRLVAIVSHLQRQGHRRVLMNLVEELAKALGLKELLVHAAPDAVGFYQQLGYSHFNAEKGDFGSVQVHKLI
jgi:N-acetylglutamate synthase-like GNAT family acetyltransferase